jgi:hypothetical protein
LLNNHIPRLISDLYIKKRKVRILYYALQIKPLPIVITLATTSALIIAPSVTRNEAAAAFLLVLGVAEPEVVLVPPLVFSPLGVFALLTAFTARPVICFPLGEKICCLTFKSPVPMILPRFGFEIPELMTAAAPEG